MSNKDISEALGLPPEPDHQPSTALQIISSDNNNDYEFARANLYELAQKGMFALEDLLMIAKASESARAYEVVSTLIKTLSETNQNLLDLAKKRKEIEGKGMHDGSGSVTGSGSTTTNQVFIGSTADLQAMFQKHGINARTLSIPLPDVIEGEIVPEPKPQDDSTE